MTDQSDEEFIAEFIGKPRKPYVAVNRCPHIRKNGEQCRKGIMAGKAKCTTHSGLSAPDVRNAHNRDKIMSSPEAQHLILAALRDGDEITDPGQLLRKAASTLQRITEHFGESLAKVNDDGSLNIDDVDLARWLTIFDRLVHLCTKLVELGILDKAVDASEIVFRREYQELAAEILDALADFPEAAQHVADTFAARALDAPRH